MNTAAWLGIVLVVILFSYGAGYDAGWQTGWDRYRYISNDDGEE